MTNFAEEIKIIEVTSENVDEYGICCIKDSKSQGFKSKIDWFKSELNDGLKIKIAYDIFDKQLGFIEYIPSEIAWRPVKAENYFFIQCIAMYRMDFRFKGIGSMLISECEKDAGLQRKSGICAMSSDGVWMADKSIFLQNGFRIAETRDRFELLYKNFNVTQKIPEFFDWNENLSKYSGWNLVYSAQCPWHEKSVTELKKCSIENGLELKVKKLTTPREAQNAPSGFGTFSLIKDGKLLADHYISKTRFLNILKKEIATK